MIAPLASRRREVIGFLLLLLVLLAFPLTTGTPLAATVDWVAPPPARITSGHSFTVSWSVSGARSFDANVHWDPTNPGSQGNPNGNISPTCDNTSTSCSTGHQRGKTSATLTAPIISPTGFPVVVKYLVHVRVPAGGRTHAFTDARAVTIDPILGSPNVTIEPTVLDFGRVPVGNCDKASFAIQHVPGSRPASGTVSTSSNPPFSISSENSFSVSDGQEVDVEVRFCPTDEGSFPDSAVVNSPGATFTNTDTVPLKGVGFKPPPPLKPVPSAPTDLTAIALSTPIAKLIWKGTSNNADGFKIERKTGTAGTFSYIGTQGTDRLFFYDSYLLASTTYCYRIAAFNASGDSDYSNEACTTTPGISMVGRVISGGSEITGGTIILPGPPLSATPDSNSGYPLIRYSGGPYHLAPPTAGCGFAPLSPQRFRFGR